MLQTILNWALKLASSGVLEQILGFLKEKELTEREKEGLKAKVAVSEIEAEIEGRKERAKLLRATEDGWDKYIRLTVFSVFFMHVGAIALDSTFSFGWGIPKLPEPYQYMESAVILFYFLYAPYQNYTKLKWFKNG